MVRFIHVLFFIRLSTWVVEAQLRLLLKLTCRSFARKLDTHTHTLRILCTELKAVPHAGLGFQFLRVHVQPTGTLRTSRGKKAKSSKRRRSDRVTTFVHGCRVRLSLLPSVKEKKSRYVGERPHRYQCSMQASSLGWYLHEQPAPLL